MVKFLLLFFLNLPVYTFAQHAQGFDPAKISVVSKKEALQDSIGRKENTDSLSVKKQLKRESEKIEVLPETPRLQLLQDALLRSSPTEDSSVTLSVKKGVVLQKIDELKSYYLVCIDGSCGYIPKKSVAKLQAE